MEQFSVKSLPVRSLLIKSFPIRSLLLFLVLSSLVTRAEEGKNIIPSTLISAMVYRNGAELTHRASARLEQGNNQLVIGDVSNAIDAASIRVGCSTGVTIMSVSVSTDFLRPAVASPFIKKLQDSIASIKKELSRLDVLSRSDSELLDLLNSNKSIAGSTTGVSVAELSKMMDYYRQKVIELRTELNGYNDKSQQLKQLSEKLDNQVREEEKKNSKTGSCLVLQLLSPQAGLCDFTISYLTTAAHWEPSYDLRVDNDTDPLRIIYKARLMQTSGIDWNHVKLSLSTSLPAQGGNAPVMKTWFLRFVDPFAASNSNAMSNQMERKDLQIRGTASLSEVAVTDTYKSRRGEAPGYTEPLYIVNGREISPSEYTRIDPRSIKKIDVLKGKDAMDLYGDRAEQGVIVITLKDELGDYVSVNDNQMDVVFDIDLPYDVPGNGKEQGVVLKEYKMPCHYQYYCAPRLDKDAYLLGEMPGWEKLNLLPGEANIIVEGTYLGKSFIDPNSIQDTLNLTLGRDKRIVVRKEKTADYSSVKFLGATKKEIFTYQITVKNNKKEKVTLLLKDQYPISSNKDIEEELLESSGAAVNKDTGVLSWKVELAPGESRRYKVSYSVKSPKDKYLNIN